MLATQIKTASDLRAFVESAREDSHFFSRENMRFAGDTMRNYGVRGPVPIATYRGETVLAWELYRRRPVKHGMQGSAYFDSTTFHQVFPKI